MSKEQTEGEKKLCPSCLAGFSKEDILGNCTCDFSPSATQSWGEGKLSAKKDEGVSYTAHDDFTGHGGLTHYYRLRHPEDKSTEIEMVSAEEANNLFRTLLLSESSRIREEMVEEINSRRHRENMDIDPNAFGFNAGLDAAISVITKKG